MSRRKQTKPQQLNSPTGIATSQCHCKEQSDHSSSDYCECMATSGQEINNNNPIKCEEKEQLILNKLSSLETKVNESEMANDEHILGETESASVDGNSSLISRVSMNGTTEENDDSDGRSTHSQDENVESVDEKRINQIVADDMSEEKRKEHTSPSQVYGCDSCGRSFTHLGDFVQHKKTSCSEQHEVEMDDDKTQQQVDEVVFNSLNGTNVAVAQMTAQHKEEDLKSSDNDVSDDETCGVSDPPAHENSGFLSSSAINNVIQSMKHLEEGLSMEEQTVGEDGKPKSKVDINGIKDQVKMIQQQQAYQIQMLNYLHWQLAMLSSNPQAAIQQVASSMRSAFPGPMPGQVPGVPPPMPPTTAPGLMPSMMAAMAMNGAGSPNMEMAAKARMMMNMQNGNPHFRSMFGRNLSGEDIERKNDNVSTGSFDPQNEQRYQLQEPPDMEKLSRMQNSDRSAVSPAKSEESLTRKSPSSQSFDSISMVAKPELKMSLSGMSDNAMQHGRESTSSSPFKDDSSENSAYRHRCKYCQKVFGSDSALQIHLRSHTGERPYKCNICGNRFTTKGNLKVHFMRHKAKYPHIPMNPHPVPEYLDGVPTSTGLPYGMSILPEKAVFERPRLHGNPSIHLNSHTNSAIPSPAANTGVFPYPNMSPEQPRPAFPLNGPAEFALMQSQLIERQRQMELMGKQRNEENNSRSAPHPDKESKPSASMLQMAMMPFFKSGGIGSMIQNERQHDGNSDGRSSYSSSGSSSPPQRRNPSETSKLQRLVENIDRGRVLQKNECHMCHRVLSCQSALKLHYRTHTGERPHKCDLCSRAFTTRGNLRTHYSSVHRQQLRALPPGGASRAGSYSCPLCHMRFFDVMEFQRHMHTHAVMHQKNEEQTEKEQRASRITPDRELEEDVDMKMEEAEEARNISVEEDENELQIDEENEEVKDTNDRKEEEPNALDLSSPAASIKTNEQSSPTCDNEENAKDQPNFPSENHLHQMNDGERAQLNRSVSREAVCELCDKSFSCNSALEIHMRCHTKERPYVCRICQRGFTTKGNLKQHLLMHNITDVPEEMLEPIASPDGRASNSNSPSSSSASAQYNREIPSPNLKRSFDSDSSGNNGPAAKQRQFPRHWCHICQKQFSSASSLQIHTRTHTGEKPFACSVCGRAFTTKGNLKVHMGTHVFGAGGSRRGRRISMDNPLISPWMRNIANQAPAPGMQMPPQNTRADPALLYQQYAALANGLLAGKQEGELIGMNSNRLLAINAGLMGQQNTSPATSPQNASASPSQMRMPTAAMNNPAMAQAATEWFLKAYQQRTQEQVN